MLLSDFFLSGQTTHVLELAKQLQKMRMLPHIAFGTIHSRLFWSDYAPTLVKNGISFSHGLNIQGLTIQCRLWKPNVIHAQSSTLFQNAQVPSSRLNIPYVVTCHYWVLPSPFSQVSDSASDTPYQRWQPSSAYSHKPTLSPTASTPTCSLHRHQKGTLQSPLYGLPGKKAPEPLKHLVEGMPRLWALLKIISNWNPNLPGTKYIPWQVNLVPHLQQSGLLPPALYSSGGSQLRKRVFLMQAMTVNLSPAGQTG